MGNLGPYQNIPAVDAETCAAYCAQSPSPELIGLDYYPDPYPVNPNSKLICECLFSSEVSHHVSYVSYRPWYFWTQTHTGTGLVAGTKAGDPKTYCYAIWPPPTNAPSTHAPTSTGWSFTDSNMRCT